MKSFTQPYIKTNLYQNAKARPVTKEQLFTGQKHGHFTVFYNVALKKVLHVIQVHNKLGADLNNQTLRNFEEKDFQGISDTNNRDKLSDYTYAILKDFLWKGFRFAKNRSGSALTFQDKVLIVKLLETANNIRNFHSHYYHHNAALQVPKDVAEFVCQLFDEAKQSFYEQNLAELNLLDLKLKQIDKGFHLFSIHDQKYMITPYGRIFLLSLFLNRGEMNKFLEEVKKVKEGKELSNDILRKIYTFYCHRDGVERFKYNQEEEELGLLDPLVQEQVLKVRQAYKIINYLNNIPQEISSSDNFPLFFEEDSNDHEQKPKLQVVKGTAEKYASLGSNYLHGFTCTVRSEIIKRKTTAKSGHNAKQGKATEEFGNEYHVNFIEIKHDKQTVCMLPHDFHRLLIFLINNKKVSIKVEGQEERLVSSVEYISQALHKYMQGRDEFTTFMQELPSTAGEPVTEEKEKVVREQWNSYSYFWKGIDVFLKVKLDNYLKQYIKGGLKQNDSRVKILETIQSKILELRYIDLFHERDEIIRRENLFVHFAVQYIKDFNLFPNWQWQHEKFEVELSNTEINQEVSAVNKRRLLYTNNKNCTDRLSIDREQQVTVLYAKEEVLGQDAKRLQKFVIAPTTLRNLLLCHVLNLNSNDLLDKLTRELVQPLSVGNLLVVKPYLTKRLQGDRRNLDSIRKKLIQKLDGCLHSLQDTLKQLKEKRLNLPRHDKNRLIMRLYKLYDWKNGKFLRKKEYNRVSVYHYYLQKAKLYALIEGSQTVKTLNANNTINRNNSTQLTDLTYMMPDKINAWLKSDHINHIDELLETILLDVIENRLPEIRKEVDTQKNLSRWCAAFNVEKPVKQSLAGEEDVVLPYVIHPMQVILLHKQNLVNNPKQDMAKFGLWQMVKNKLDSNGLRKEYYSINGYLEYVQTLLKNKNSHEIKKIGVFKNALGNVNRVLSQDQILWYITQKYMGAYNEGRNATNRIGLERVENIRRQVISIPVRIYNGGTNKDYLVECMYHQLDDFMFFEKRDYLKKLLDYFARRTAVEPNYPISLKQLYEQRVKLNEYALLYSKIILNWESIQFGKVKTNYKPLLTTDKGFERIDFKAYCERKKNGFETLEADRDEALQLMEKEIRNKAFHADIPTSVIYEDLTEENKPILFQEFIKPFLQHQASEIAERKANLAKSKNSGYGKGGIGKNKKRFVDKYKR